MEFALLFLPLLASITLVFLENILVIEIQRIITSLFVSISALLSLILFYQVIVNRL